MSDLDQQATYRRWDPSGLGGRLRGLAEKCRAGWSQGEGFSPPAGWKPDGVDKIVVCGMGGSAIAGDLAFDLMRACSAASGSKTRLFQVVRGMEFPFSLDSRSLVLPCSHSGNTGETIALFHKAIKEDARVLAMAGGGQLADEASALGSPLLQIATTGEPRSAIGYSLMLLLSALSKLGMADFSLPSVESATCSLERRLAELGEETPTARNPAKQLALALEGKVVAIYGGGLFAGMARRWKTQLNENAKAWAFFEEVPELLHNAVEALEQPTGSAGMTVVFLRPSVEVDPLEAHYGAVEAVLEENGVPVEVLSGDPRESPLAQLLSMLALGDYVSYYLAMLGEVDPSPAPNIARSKDLLSEFRARHRGR